MKRDKPTSGLQVSALAMGGPLDQGAPKDDGPAILLVNGQPPRSASVAERLRLLEIFLTEQRCLQKIDTVPETTDSLRRFVRKVPSCDIVHCYLAEPETWTLSALGHVLVARFFGKTFVADLGFSINAESFEHPPVILRMILELCTVAVVTSEHAAAILARRGVKAVQIPEALASYEFTDRRVNSVQPQILTVYPHADPVAAECVMKAFNMVKVKYPRTQMTILVDGSDHVTCRQWIGERERSGITVATTSDACEAAPCYAEADMFVNSSVAGGLRPMLKAMACGLPVVAATGYFRDELIVDRRNGLAFRENDPGELADRIIELIETPDLIHELTDHARLAAAEHAWSKISGRWQACYRRLRLSRRAATIPGTGHHSHQPT